MMRWLGIAFLLICGLAVGAVKPDKNPLPARLIAEHGVILGPKIAPELFDQCSRPAPKFTGKQWAPTAAHIAKLEGSFPGYLKETVKISDLVLERYYRQYAGFVTNDGRRLVYANFFKWAIPSKELQKLDPVRWDPERWKKMPIIICDGGSASFGVVFDPATGKFSDLEFNGF